MAYDSLTAYIRRRHREEEQASRPTIERTISPGFGDLDEYFRLDVDGMLTDLQVHASTDGGIWHYVKIRVAEGNHLYVANPTDRILRRIDRPDEVERIVDEAIGEGERTSGPIGGIMALAEAMNAGRFEEEQGLNNQPVGKDEVNGLIAFCDRGQPITVGTAES